MAYTWTDGELITAEKLNETGGGVLIVNATYDESTQKSTLDKTWQEIYDAIKQKTQVIIEQGYSNTDSEHVELLPVTSIDRGIFGCSVTALIYDVRQNTYTFITFSSTTTDGYPSFNAGDETIDDQPIGGGTNPTN